MKEHSVNNAFAMGDRTYNLIKRFVQVILPAISALYFGLAAIWDLPAAEQVVGTIAVITTFLGVSLGISTSQYVASGAAYDGKIIVTPNESGGTLYSLELDGDPSEIADKEKISFKVTEAVPKEDVEVEQKYYEV